MSMDTCKDCGRILDTDDDPDCFVEEGDMKRITKTIVLCESCREERVRDAEYLADLASRHEAEAEYRAKFSNKKETTTGSKETINRSFK